MRTIRSKSGPFAERPHFKTGEIEALCLKELRTAELLPSDPGPIRVDRFIERRFGVSPRYERLPEGVLGFSKFGVNGVEDVVVAVQLDEEGTQAAGRRLRSTLAHEAGHGLLHAYLFTLGANLRSLFDGDTRGPEILCRDVQGVGTAQGYDGRWWEYQANRAIGGLLLPLPLVERALEPFLVETGGLGKRGLKPGDERRAERTLVEIFDVNPAVVRIRLGELLPPRDAAQLSL